MYTHWSASGPCDFVQLLLNSLDTFVLGSSWCVVLVCVNRAVAVLIPCQAKFQTVIGNIYYDYLREVLCLCHLLLSLRVQEGTEVRETDEVAKAHFFFCYRSNLLVTCFFFRLS